MDRQVCGIIGSGAMGTGIAQVASLAGWKVMVYDNNKEALSTSSDKLLSILNRLALKNKLSNEEAKKAFRLVHYVDDLKALEDSDLIIEAIVEDIDIKKPLFKSVESIVDKKTIIASNTSSLSITSLASSLDDPSRMIGIHFFNPPGLMKLVEIIPGHLTAEDTTTKARAIIQSWGKDVVIAKDTPGFIVNKVARPFYSEALKIYEEGIASPGQIDWVMTELGGFRMGPFTLMDYIGHDVNFAVTDSVWRSFFFEPRYKPSLAQKTLVEAGKLGRKSGEGFYDYSNDEPIQLIKVENDKAQYIFKRILFMLVNEAADTVYLGICNEPDVELAMTNGVNYPKGLLAWGEEYGWVQVKSFLDELFHLYHEERYRVSPFITKKIYND